MHADKRRAGRAIRKQRRLEREAIATALTWDFTPAVEAFAQFGRALEAVAAVMAEAAEQFVALVVPLVKTWREAIAEWLWLGEWRKQRERFDWRLAHRALTTGPAHA